MFWCRKLKTFFQAFQKKTLCDGNQQVMRQISEISTGVFVLIDKSQSISTKVIKSRMMMCAGSAEHVFRMKTRDIL
jgi:hypothetical protein